MFHEFFFPELLEITIQKWNGADRSLTYHNLAHTLDVVEQASRIAKAEGLDSEDILLLKVAALYHDLGYLQGPQRHEERSCSIFFNDAQKWNFSSQQIEKVERLIMATKVPQKPLDVAQKIICDADLDYLGREDFFLLGKNLRKEYLHFGIVKNVLDWEKRQIDFLEMHEYFTASSKKLREPKKQKNLEKLKKQQIGN